MVPTVIGVYCSRTEETVGTGTTRKTQENVIYWFVARSPGGDILAQPLNSQFLPSGFVQHVEDETFLAVYELEMPMYDEYLFGIIHSLRDKLGRMKALDDLHALTNNEARVLSALAAFLHGRSVPSVSVADLPSLREMVDGMRLSGDMIFEYQKALTGAAINLRKTRHFEKAVEYYTRALRVEGQNDHVLFNLARVYFEMGRVTDAKDALRKALALNSEMELAKRFLRFLTTPYGS